MPSIRLADLAQQLDAELHGDGDIVITGVASMQSAQTGHIMEIMDIRMRGGFPRANALRYVADKHNVNWMACVCALDRAALPPLTEYWVPEVTVSGLHELVANALVMKGEIPRTMDLRQEDLPFPDEDPAASEEA